MITFSEYDLLELKNFKSKLIEDKRKLKRKIDVIDTELMGVKEELRKREDKGLEGQIYPKDYTQD